ncbi:MAG: tRNA (adenosine(37)-N6)-threonylcarbamoyltransferase complex dimerization subunit type 1 TsaB [Chloroflexi bacterium AL-W]|nr:tRNA (adenosine(37)-N6)-threonylcarbamoyltransferase complex dimerization subunit type 1 TsaB [Chloroflexi bacterium AL-N1]NOK70264.1 tRNA (adenosine(37)-N6)-threonylcarbamoyltransferase complex dimerization subunit type 1 TsaB [Chloroflexi bacterium AL-N10]NOK77801.1 tRNA (adenosine(37)-N6)-threonylcarbamoyltransferase complex dimerization subunit type 1 TsaB [Chloroflexi bacterium AL-N5]NOK84810.1 tRNA (adenosine(37)-N6)-threonylcarbamoyltransferase complex dimerization subunit type 1 TsaB 
MLLAIDTSTVQTGLACYDANGILGECSWFSGRDHTTQLLPQLHLLLQHLGRTQEHITAVGVALGPGSWSGLRVGVSIAKGLALARQTHLLGIGTLDVIAYQHFQPGIPIYPLIRLGRERFATATYTDSTPWQRTSEYRNLTLSELVAEIDGRAYFCGDIDSGVQASLQKGVGPNALFPGPATNLRRSGYLAELAWQRLQSNETDDYVTLEPIYLGQSVKKASL